MKSRENEKENREIRWQGPFSRPLLWWSGALDSGPQRCSLWTGRGEGPGTWRHCPQRVNVALRGDHDGHEHGPLRGRDAVHGGGDVQGPRHVHVRHVYVRHVPGRDVPGRDVPGHDVHAHDVHLYCDIHPVRVVVLPLLKLSPAWHHSSCVVRPSFRVPPALISVSPRLSYPSSSSPR